MEHQLVPVPEGLLKSFRSLLWDCCSIGWIDDCHNAAKQIDNLLAAARTEAEALRKDAERYRWLRDAGTRDYAVIMESGGGYLKMNDNLDGAIDAARSTEERHG